MVHGLVVDKEDAQNLEPKPLKVNPGRDPKPLKANPGRGADSVFLQGGGGAGGCERRGCCGRRRSLRRLRNRP